MTEGEKTLRNYAWIARRFPVSRRRGTLTLQHHAEVAALSDHEQERWLDRAEQEQWPVLRLRTSLRAQATVQASQPRSPSS